MKIVIETIPHDQQRYPTAGDWVFDATGLKVYVSALGDPAMEALVGLHEVIEALLCERRGIEEPVVRAFDEAHLNDANPGGSPDAPYHREHQFAEKIEHKIAMELGVDWEDYEGRICALFD